MIHKLFWGFAVALTLCFAACRNDPPNHLKHDPNYTHAYACSMDCEKGKTYEQPGECPVCRMKLVQKEVRVKDLKQNADSSKIRKTP